MAEINDVNLGCISMYSEEDITNYDSDGNEDNEMPPDPNEIVIREKSITIHFDYPFHNNRNLEFQSNNGFTRQKIIDLVLEQYKKIYENKVTRTDWGVYGHSMGDLILHSIYKEGDVYKLGIDS